jgi:hypothetical protein
MHNIMKALVVAVGGEPASPGQTSTQAALLCPAVLLNDASDVINRIRFSIQGGMHQDKK